MTRQSKPAAPKKGKSAPSLSSPDRKASQPPVTVIPPSESNVPASRVATRAITFYVSEERFRTLDLARRALRDRPTWSVLGNGWADQWLASLPDEVFRISR